MQPSLLLAASEKLPPVIRFSETLQNSNPTHTIPAGVEVGDILIMVSTVGTDSDSNVGNAWFNGGYSRYHATASAAVGFRILDGTEAGTSVRLNDGANGNATSAIVIMDMKGRASVGAGDWIVKTSGNMSPYTFLAGATSAPKLVVVGMSTLFTTGLSTSMTPNDFSDTSTRHALYLKWIADGANEDVTADMNDAGAQHFYGKVFLEA